MKTLMNVSKVVALVALLGFACTLVPSSAQAQATGQTKMRITFPPFAILWYYSQLNITLSTSDLVTALGTGAEAVDEGSKDVTLSTWGADAAMSPAALTGLGNQTVTIQNAWYYVAMSSATSTLKADITAGADLTLENGAATVALSNFKIQSGGSGYVASIDPLNEVGFVLTPGDLQFTMDLTNASAAGNYENGVGSWEYQISLSYY